jgi:membrane associated rhomboid family serine protease
VLGTLVLLYGRKEFFSVTIAIMLLSGAAVWLIGRASYHVGASGLVFGYFGYLLAKGWYDRKFSSITIAIAVALLYGGMIWGIFPTNLYISWEAHLFGFLSGILIAKARKSK